MPDSHRLVTALRVGIAAAVCALSLSISVSARRGGSQATDPSPPQTASAPVSTSAPARGVVAVMRRDGLMLPFASFKGTRWSTPWPASTRLVELPVDVDSVPEDWWGGDPPGPLTVHLPGGVVRPVTMRAPRVYRSFCQTRIGMVTDYRSAEPIPLPPPSPYPKDGLVLPAGMELLPIDSISPAAPDTLALAQSLMPAFDKAEDQTLATIHGAEQWVHPVNGAARHARPVVIEAWYRAPMDEPGWIASYIEAARVYGPGLVPGDAGCGLETVFTGWVHTNTVDPKKSRWQITARVTYCDRNGVKYMLPFGRVHVGGQLYWIYQFSSFNDEWYEVARMTPVKMAFVVETYGGGTRGCAQSAPGR